MLLFNLILSLSLLCQATPEAAPPSRTATVSVEPLKLWCEHLADRDYYKHWRGRIGSHSWKVGDLTEQEFDIFCIARSDQLSEVLFHLDNICQSQLNAIFVARFSMTGEDQKQHKELLNQKIEELGEVRKEIEKLRLAVGQKRTDIIKSIIEKYAESDPEFVSQVRLAYNVKEQK